MLKKISLIIFLAILLAGGMIFRHYWMKTTDEPTVVDRLPEGDYLIKSKILDFAQEMTGMLHFNKVQFRDFASKEFLLGQAKTYGLDLQRPVHAFVNENGSWGVVVYVSDSSEVGAGVQRMSKLLDLKDSLIGKQKIYLWEEEDGYLSYEKNWLLIYKGKAFSKTLKHILYTKKGGVSPKWKAFLKEKQFKNKSLVIYSNSKSKEKYGLEKAMFAHNVDSTSVTLLSYVKSLKPLNFSQKTSGLAMEKSLGSKKYLNLHLNIDEFRRKKEDPLYKLLERESRKFNFPLDDFLETWNGDLSFGEGENQIIKETFIESVLDENFEVSEVVSIKKRKVKGFAIAVSMNDGAEAFLKQLRKKGLLREEDGKSRFLISPPLSVKKQDDYYLFYSAQAAPALKQDSANSGYLTYKGTPFTFHLDTIIDKEAFGKIEFPVNRVIRRNKFF